MNMPYAFEDKLNRAAVFNYRQDPVYRKLFADKSLNNVGQKRSSSSNYIRKTRRAIRSVERPVSVKPEMDFMKRYEIQKKLGAGSYGEVHLAQDKNTGNHVAIKKVLGVSESEDGIPQSTLREVSLLNEINHPNIVNLNEVHIDMAKSQLWLNFEYIKYDLQKYMKELRMNHDKLSLKDVRDIMYKIISGMNYLHERGIIHRDLKPQNIQVSGGLSEVKIADLGLAKKMQQSRPMSNEIVTLYYRAPEILLGATNYGIGVDIWSIGCIMAELFIGKPIFFADSSIGCIFDIFKLCGTPNERNWTDLNKQPHFKKNFPRFKDSQGLNELLKINNIDHLAMDLIKRFQVINPLERISQAQALEHPFFK